MSDLGKSSSSWGSPRHGCLGPESTSRRGRAWGSDQCIRTVVVVTTALIDSRRWGSSLGTMYMFRMYRGERDTDTLSSSKEVSSDVEGSCVRQPYDEESKCDREIPQIKNSELFPHKN